MDYQRFYYQQNALPIKREDGEPEEKAAYFSSIYSKLVAATLTLLAIVVIINASFSTGSDISATINPVKSAVKSQSSHNVEFEIKIDSPGYSTLKSYDLLPWSLIAEPARNQVIYISKMTVNDEEIAIDEDKMDIKWTIDDKEYTGKSAVFQLPGTYFGTSVDFTVTVSAKESKELAKGVNSLYYFTHSDQIMVKYVRREFRTLTDDDKERFTKAMSALYSLDDATGQAKYGSKFRSAEYFLNKHLTGGGMTDCDHWHDGAGLVTHHTAVTLELEQALQAVDPSVTVPYWEYGMDAYLYDNLADSPIFSNDMLGEMNPTNEEHRIMDGSFWSTVKLPDGTKYKEGWDISRTGSLNPYVNAFGVMRSPWNNNPSEYIGRHNLTYGASQYSTLPSCNLLQSCFQSDNMADINYCLNGYTHGPVHIMIGGAWGDDDIFADGSLKYIQNPDKILFFKILWRMGYTRCPDTCDINEYESCRCAVPQEYLDKYGTKKILINTNIIYPIAKQLKNADDATYLKVLKAIEHPGFAGEMFTSSASFDPTFWPLHGSMERMLGFKRVLAEKGEIEFDETWGYPEYNKADGAAYLPGRCDWSKVSSSSDLTLPECDMSATCDGHAEDDVLEFSNFLNTGETYTNIEFYNFLHPWNDELPYVYDDYAFDYCTDNGYDFLDTSNSNSIHDKNKKGSSNKFTTSKRLRAVAAQTPDKKVTSAM
jgi:hypothetical protein